MRTETIICQAPDQRRISLQSTCLITQCFIERGLPVEPLLHASGLTPGDLSDPARLISPEQEQRIFANAQRLSGSPLIALALGQRMRISAYGQLGYAMLSSATLGQAIRVMLTHPNILGSYFRLAIEEIGDHIRLTASGYHQDAALHTFNVELCLSSIKAMLDDVLGACLPLHSVLLSGPLPNHAERYGDYFGDCRVTAQANVDAFMFHCKWLDTPLPLADPVTHHEALQQCSSLETRFSRSASPLLASLIDRLEPVLADPPGLDELAGEFHCTARTLRRHLRQLGSGYQQLLDELRATHAKRLLSEPEPPIYLIAERLGFSETASFRHAFLRWTGVTPRAWREAGGHGRLARSA